MVNEQEILEKLHKRLAQLEYHQTLLLEMIHPQGHEFNQLIIKKNLSETEVKQFFELCEELDQERIKQKADQFVFYAPLFSEFEKKLNSKLQPNEVINACLSQYIFTGLMKVLQKNIR